MIRRTITLPYLNRLGKSTKNVFSSEKKKKIPIPLNYYYFPISFVLTPKNLVPKVLPFS